MSYWTVERQDGVAIASYSNPPMNYLVGEAIGELTGLIETFRDPELRVLILTGAPDDQFITHFSVEDLLDVANNKDLVDAIDFRISDGFHAMTKGLQSLPIPVICAMNGNTMGGGFELSLGCDIRIAQSGNFRIGLPEARLGILPGGGGTQRLTRLLGSGQAINMILRGMVVPPEEALAKGMVHEVATDAKARALEIAKDLATLSSTSMKEIKHAIYEGEAAPLDVGLHIEASSFLETMKTDHARAAMKAYADTPFEDRLKSLDN